MVERLCRALLLLVWLAGAVGARAEAPPARVVSLLPALTEAVCVLGACDRLVGVDRYSNWPAAVRRLPQLGGGLDPQIEQVLALKPDLVLMASSSRAGTRLAQLGLRVVTLEPQTHADVRAMLTRLAQLLGLPPERATQVWADAERQLREAEAVVPARARGVRVYFEVNPAPYAASEASFIGETLHRLGARNVVPARLGAFPKLNPEWVVQARPDLILMGEDGVAQLAQRPGWSALVAVRQQRVCRFSPAVADVLVRPGPRLGEAALHLARCLAEKAP